MKKKLQSCLLVLCCFSLVLPLAEARITKFYDVYRGLYSNYNENGEPTGPFVNDAFLKVYVNTKTNNALIFSRARVQNLSRRFLRFRNDLVGGVFVFNDSNIRIASNAALISPFGRVDEIFRGQFQDK